MKYASPLTGFLFSKKNRYDSNEDLRENMLPMSVLADDVFGIVNLPQTEADSFYDVTHNPNLHEEVGFQLQLPLEDPHNLLAHYRSMIHRYEQAYEKMAMFAVKWHALMEDVERDPTIKKMFTDMQIMRKLTGSSVI